MTTLLKCVVGSSLFVANPKDRDLLILTDEAPSFEYKDHLRAQHPGYDVFVHQVSKTPPAYNLYQAQMAKEGKTQQILEGAWPYEATKRGLLEICFDRNVVPSSIDSRFTLFANRHFYWVLLISFFLKRGNTDLTDAERALVQKTHDGQLPIEEARYIRAELVDMLSKMPANEK